MRRAHLWSYWALVIANLATLVHYVVIISVTYAGARQAGGTDYAATGLEAAFGAG